tara:strand:- start:909 stop:1082 length:174 start_codon:yes stop_codon:yes gene_type:complete
MKECSNENMEACKRKMDKSYISRMIKPKPKKKLDLKKIFVGTKKNKYRLTGRGRKKY